MSTMIDDILAQVPADQLATKLDTDPDTAVDAAKKAIPALLGGLSQNVEAGGGDALGKALARDHDGSLLDQTNPLAQADVEDGQKIVGHIFGDQENQVVERLGATSRAGTSIFTKILPILAPFVMAWVAKKVGSAISGAASGGAAGEGGGGLGGILTNLGLGGGESSSGSGGGGLGGLLSSLFGGDEQQAGAAGSAGGLSSLLGGLLGREVEAEKSAMPDLGDLFNIFGGTAGGQQSVPTASKEDS